MWWLPGVLPALLTALSCTALGWFGPQGQSRPREEGRGSARHSLSLLCGQHLPTPPGFWLLGHVCVHLLIKGLQYLPRELGLEAGGRGSEATLEGPHIPAVSRCPASPLDIRLYPWQAAC